MTVSHQKNNKNFKIAPTNLPKTNVSSPLLSHPLNVIKQPNQGINQEIEIQNEEIQYETRWNFNQSNSLVQVLHTSKQLQNFHSKNNLSQNYVLNQIRSQRNFNVRPEQSQAGKTGFFERFGEFQGYETHQSLY